MAEGSAFSKTVNRQETVFLSIQVLSHTKSGTLPQVWSLQLPPGPGSTLCSRSGYPGQALLKLDAICSTAWTPLLHSQNSHYWKNVWMLHLVDNFKPAQVFNHLHRFSATCTSNYLHIMQNQQIFRPFTSLLDQMLETTVCYSKHRQCVGHEKLVEISFFFFF